MAGTVVVPRVNSARAGRIIHGFLVIAISKQGSHSRHIQADQQATLEQMRAAVEGLSVVT